MNCDACDVNVSAEEALYGESGTAFCPECYGSERAQQVIENKKLTEPNSELVKNGREEIAIKFKLILLPYLILLITSLVIFTFARWYFDVKLNVLAVDEKILNIYAPGVFAFLSLFLVMHKRFDLLLPNEKNKRGKVLSTFMVLALGGTLIFSQLYISSASYGLVKLESALDIEQHKNEKFFQIADIKTDPSSTAVGNDFYLEGKHGETLWMEIYAAVPIDKTLNLWYGVMFKHSMSESAEQSEKEEEYRLFAQSSEKEFVDYDYNKAIYFELLKQSRVKTNFLQAIDEEYGNAQGAYVLLPHFSPFEERMGGSHFYLILPLIFGFIAVVFSLMVAGIDPERYEAYLNKAKGKKSK